MSKTNKIIGGYTFKCNNCEKEDGRQTLYWDKEDFNLCLLCLNKLFFEYIAPEYKSNESVKVRRMAISEELRNKVFDKNNFCCAFCGSSDWPQIDHIIPFSLGGKTEFENLQILCKKCNKEKGNGR